MTSAFVTGPRLWDLPEREAFIAVGERLATVRRRQIHHALLYRAMVFQHLVSSNETPPDPLYYRGSLAGRRYTPPGGPAGLYLAFDPSTPPAELRAVVFEHGFPATTEQHDPILTICVRACLCHVLDLTDEETCRTLDLSERLLRADWEQEQETYLAGEGPMPATQFLSLVAYTSELITAIKYPSTRTAFGVNLMVFPNRLSADAGDFLEVVDDSGRFTRRLPS